MQRSISSPQAMRSPRIAPVEIGERSILSLSRLVAPYPEVQ